MAVVRRTRQEIEHDRVIISELYLQGKTRAEIARILNANSQRSYTLNIQTIARDIEAIRQEWMKQSVQNYNEAKAREFARIDRLERAYYDEWLRSKSEPDSPEPEKKQTGRGKRQPLQEERSSSRREKPRMGDIRFLHGVEWCIERRCQLLGLDSPKGFVHSGEIKVAEEELSDKQLNEKIAEYLGKAVKKSDEQDL